ncbi:MAG: PQQ-binding-like beta-propeller repeat protein [bacterium]
MRLLVPAIVVVLLLPTGASAADPTPAPDSLVAVAEADTALDLELKIFPPDGVRMPYRYQVDWGDGDTLGWTDPLRFSYEVMRAHRYTTWGDFAIRVRLSDSLGMVSEWSRPLGVRVGPSPLRWVFETFDPVVATPVVDENGNIYVGDDSGWFYSLDSTGILRWGFEAGAAFFASAALDGRRVYVGSLDSNLYCLDRDNGNVLWQLGVADEVYVPPAIDARGNLIVGTDRGRVLAVTPDRVVIWPRRRILWQFDTGQEITGAPSIAADGSVLVTADSLYCLTPRGRRNWAYGGEDGYFFPGPVPGPDGTAYVGDSEGRFHAVGPDGTRLWRLAVGDEDEIRTEVVAGPDGALWLGTDGYYLCRLDPPGPAGPPPGAGFRVMYEADDIISSTPAVSDKGTVYFLADDGVLYALRADGRLLWRQEVAAGDKDTYYTSSPVIGPDGTVYVGSWDGGVYAFRGDGPPALSFWPQYRRDARNSGRLALP